MPFTPEQIEHLTAKLDPAHVIQPKKGGFGPKGDYIEGWHAIAEANRIFGFDGWSYHIVELHECHAPYENKNGNWIVSYTAQIHAHIGDAHRVDIGFGSGASKIIGDAHESAVKEAVTDGLKRCLRTFGNPFGLALYDKTRANVGNSAGGNPIPDGQRVKYKENLIREMGEALADCGSMVALNKLRDDYKQAHEPWLDDTFNGKIFDMFLTREAEIGEQHEHGQTEHSKATYCQFALSVIAEAKTPAELEEWFKAEKAESFDKYGLTSGDVGEIIAACKARKAELLIQA